MWDGMIRYLYYHSTVVKPLLVKSWIWLISFPLCLLHHVMPFVGYCWGDGGISDEKNTLRWSHEGFSALMLSQTCLLAGFCELGTLNLGYCQSRLDIIS